MKSSFNRRHVVAVTSVAFVRCVADPGRPVGHDVSTAVGGTRGGSHTRAEGEVRDVFPPKEIALNLLMHSSAVRARARRRHNTGVLSDPDHGRRVLESFAALIPVSLAGAKVLEIGPGRGTELARAAVEVGTTYSAFDVTGYLDGNEIADLAIDYRVDPSGRLPWPDGSFDVVWSHSVLEHVPVPETLLNEVRRVIRVGGHHVALIDLETHLGARGDPGQMYEFLKYPPWLWNLMTSHRSSYVNGVRLSQWREMFAEAGFEIADEVIQSARCGLDQLRAVPYLRSYGDEDLLAKAVTISSRAVPITAT